ncbi:hypothetical protein AcW1_001642 [Taiwanofungus camphoratus]|nr:hypothetical protein AcV5_000315 [Antrodia cinnamomea]KAI0944790.1 hypothetical protein AcV7_001499 [Antrodia cinnamomea]KAI0945410.1 hypothetical protein AcW1_001642 [Antrodia cinnamomea]
MSIDSLPQKVDVLVVGGGPTGLLTNYILLKNGLKALSVERYSRTEQAAYGRACVLYPRSLEFLDMVGIYERIADTGFIVRGALTIKDGQTVPTRGWHFVQKVIDGNSYFDFCLGIRQKYIENAMVDAIEELDPDAVQAPARLLNFSVDKSSVHPVTAILDVGGRHMQVHCKYLVGADGSRSITRTLSQIGFPGSLSSHKWVRLDAVVETNLPASRGPAVAIESAEYGNVLWLPISNGRTRIGFVCKDEVYGEDGKGVTAEIIMKEAKKALLPNTLTFVKLDWWTVYAIGQRVAEKFKDGPVILAGDAAHTHSSGAGQGMNTGIHDATNLAWKLTGVVKGWLKEEVLDTYESERRASAQRLIDLDRDIADLISGKIPHHFNPPPGADVNEYLYRVFEESAGFTVGLGISYAGNVFNKASSSPKAASHVTEGHRAPDATLYRPGAAFPRRLQEIAASAGHKFCILVFAGKLERVADAVRLNQKTVAKYHSLRACIDSTSSFTQKVADIFDILTILQGEGTLQPSETIGVPPLGRTAYDYSGEAYAKYGVDPLGGAIVTLRPDGIIGFVGNLDSWLDVEEYFGGFSQSVNIARKAENSISEHTLGEVSVEGQEESTQ